MELGLWGQVAKTVFSSLMNVASTVADTQKELQLSHKSLSELSGLSPQDLIQKVFELRGYSVQLFQGVDFYEAELDEILTYLGSRSPSTPASTIQSSSAESVTALTLALVPKLRVLTDPEALVPKLRVLTDPDQFRTISTIYKVQIQLQTIADRRSELENAYLQLLRHEYKIDSSLEKHYDRARQILTENPKSLFREDSPGGDSPRANVDHALSQLRHITSKEQDKWEKKDAFRHGVTVLHKDLEDEYTHIATNKLELDERLTDRYQKARETLALPITTLESGAKKKKLDEAKRLLSDLRILSAKVRQDKLRREKAEADGRKAKQEEEERKQQSEIDQQKKLRQLVQFIGIFIGIPLILLLSCLGLLAWVYADNPNYVDAKIPFLEIPYSIIFWSALGSIAAMLHWVNIYKEEHFGTLWETFRWAFTRPLIGIIMGVVMYLAAYGGLVITVGKDATINYALLWLFAFVGGFSDKVQQGLIRFVIGKFKFAPNDSSADKEGR